MLFVHSFFGKVEEKIHFFSAFFIIILLIFQRVRQHSLQLTLHQRNFARRVEAVVAGSFPFSEFPICSLSFVVSYDLFDMTVERTMIYLSMQRF